MKDWRTNEYEDPEKDPHRYDDMLLLPHHVSDRHPRMSIAQRAAQFLPYRSLSGFEEKIDETKKKYLENTL